MFSIISHQENTNQDDLTPIRMLKIKTQVTTHAGEDVEKEEQSTIVGRIVN